MSYDVLDGIRRRLVGSTGSAPQEPRPDGRARSTSTDTTPLLADGGEAGDRGDDPDPDEHLRDLPDGAGCTEIWEHLSERGADD